MCKRKCSLLRDFKRMPWRAGQLLNLKRTNGRHGHLAGWARQPPLRHTPPAPASLGVAAVDPLAHLPD